MNQEYSVTTQRTKFYDGDYQEYTQCYEYSTWEDALKKYEDEVREQSYHISTLNNVKVDLVIKMARKERVQYRVKISN